MSDPSPVRRAVVDVLLYAVVRTLLAAVLSVFLMVTAHTVGLDDFPLAVAVALALVIALPLGMWVFAPLRRRATAGVADIARRRQEDRAQLQARLRGDSPD